MAADWSQEEVEAITTDYFAMLASELREESYSKTAHRRALAALLNDRSDASIERKHQNISAVLIAVGYPYINGYKPLGNFQKLLGDVVIDRVANDQHLAGVVSKAVSEPAAVPEVSNILGLLEQPPEGTPFLYTGVSEALVKKSKLPPVNYLEREARNTSLGRAGEEFVVRYERARLIHFGIPELANQVEHVAVTQGDGLGFDVRSYEPDGQDRFIEVKTTAYGKQTPFFISRNELAVSEVRAKSYHLLRLFEFRDQPRLYALRGALSEVCTLQPVQFAARPK